MAVSKSNLVTELLEKDKIYLEDSLPVFGISLIYPGLLNDSSMRTVMAEGHSRQFVDLINPEVPKVDGGYLNMAGRHSTSYYQVDHKSRVYKRIDKYPGFSKEPYIYALFIYDEEKHRYDVKIRQPCQSLNEKYGYAINNDKMDSLKEGSVIKKGEVLHRATAFDDYMNYRFGRNATFLYSDDPYTSEDACTISESFAKSMTSVQCETIRVGINDNDYPCNLYGDREHYMPFPMIGQEANSVLIAIRRLFTNQVLFDFKDSNLSVPNYQSDKIFYVKGQIYDIDIFCNNTELERNPFMEEIMDLYEAQTEYYQQIRDTCREIMDSGENYTHEIEHLYNRAGQFLNQEYKWKDRENQFSNLVIDFHIMRVVEARVGQKFSARYGNKSVVSKIVPDDQMPILDNGKVVDIIYNIHGVINRTTGFPLIELHLNLIGNRMIEEMKKMETDDDRANFLFEVLSVTNEEWAGKYRKIYNRLGTKGRKDFIQSVYDNGVLWCIPTEFKQKPTFLKIYEIWKRWPQLLKPHDVYINRFGRKIKVLKPQYAGEMYIIKLQQTSEKGFSARGAGSVNMKGTPERSYKNRTHQDTNSETAVRFGEYETFNFMIAMDPYDVQIFNLLYRSGPQARKDFDRQLMNPNHQYLKGNYNNRVVDILNVYFKSLGVKLRFVDRNSMLKGLDNSRVETYEYRGKYYICTEYEMELIQRKDWVIDQILTDASIMETDELKKQALEILNSGEFIEGPEQWVEEDLELGKYDKDDILSSRVTALLDDI